MPGAVDPVQALAAAARGGSRPEPRLVAREFEALVLGEMMRAAAKPLAGSQLLSGGSAGRLYHELFLQEVARQVAAQGGLGLGRALGATLQSEGPTTEAGEGEQP